MGHGVAVFTFLAGICTFNPVNGLMRLLVSPFSPFTGGGLFSSFDLRFSGRGGKNAVGEVDGVWELVLLLELLDDDWTDVDDGAAELAVVDVVAVADILLPEPVEEVVVVVVGVPDVVVVRPPRPFAPPFRNLL